uniref:fascin domain-containing protein n=1 Tax=Herbidospora sakaeratensis TaxID=564415 RepID=UPI000785A061|nr:hypothetical protein [Herbidospora sakaeratensis]
MKSPGEWEKFSLCPGPGYKTLYSCGAKRYAGADKGMLRARSDSVKPFEQFTVDCNTGNYCTIRSPANGKYANDCYPMLRARADTVGSYEKFLIS